MSVYKCSVCNFIYDEDKEKYREISKELSTLSVKFNQNTLNLPDNFELLIEIKNFLVLRLPKDIEYSNFEGELGLRKI